MAEIPGEAVEAAARAAFESDWIDGEPEWHDLLPAEADSYRVYALRELAAAAPYIAAQALRELHAEVQPRLGYAEIADLIDARADEYRELAARPGSGTTARLEQPIDERPDPSCDDCATACSAGEPCICAGCWDPR